MREPVTQHESVDLKDGFVGEFVVPFAGTANAGAYGGAIPPSVVLRIVFPARTIPLAPFANATAFNVAY